MKILSSRKSKQNENGRQTGTGAHVDDGVCASGGVGGSSLTWVIVSAGMWDTGNSQGDRVRSIDSASLLRAGFVLIRIYWRFLRVCSSCIRCMFVLGACLCVVVDHVSDGEDGPNRHNSKRILIRMSSTEPKQEEEGDDIQVKLDDADGMAPPVDPAPSLLYFRWPMSVPQRDTIMHPTRTQTRKESWSGRV